MGDKNAVLMVIISIYRRVYIGRMDDYYFYITYIYHITDIKITFYNDHYKMKSMMSGIFFNDSRDI